MNCTYIRTPYADTPSSPTYFRSWKLYMMLTMEADILLISSEEPFAQACSMGLISSLVFVRRSKLVLGRIKYISGRMPPTHWLIPVARAAPATPHRNRPTKNASSAIFVIPADTVAASPSCGFSAAIKKLWNTFWSMNVNVKPMTILP